MIELTAGYVAGFIAIFIVFAQIWLPTVITFILANQLADRATAGTWTVTGRLLQNSYWPLLLQTDSSQSVGVRRTVSIVAVAIPCLALLVSIASIVTPMGLYEIDEINRESTAASFQYTADSSSFFQGTSPRDSVTFTRKCRFDGLLGPCPYTSDASVIETNGTGTEVNVSFISGANTTLPNIIHDIYMSGTKNIKTTISNFFDIEWRQMAADYDERYNFGKPSEPGFCSSLDSTLFIDGYRPVEGLVIDGKTGGVGFRNHTVPIGHPKGAAWSEDILFLEPEVECVGMNLSMDFNISMFNAKKGGFGIPKINLVDHGGFIDLKKSSFSFAEFDEPDEPNKPLLKSRAHRAAYLTNAFLMQIMGITNVGNASTKTLQWINSTLGQQFPLAIENMDRALIRGLQVSPDFSFVLGKLWSESLLYPNRDQPDLDEGFMGIRTPCQGRRMSAANTSFVPDDWITTLNDTSVACFLVKGVPNRLDKGPPNIFEHKSQWSSPLYSCAAAVKATIKTVDFFHNGTSEDLKNLHVTNIHTKKYKNKSDIPLWGTENWPLRLDDYNPVWGLIDPSLEHFGNITTLRSPSLYLPGSQWTRDNLLHQYPRMNLPGSIAPLDALETIVDGGYSGVPGIALWLKWKGLSGSDKSTSKILKLIWTDIMASIVVGSKGVNGARNSQADKAVKLRVQPTVHRVKYRWKFGIPVFIVVSFILTAFLALIGLGLMGGLNIGAMRHRLNQVSLGRVLTTMQDPETSDFQMGSKEWSKVNGRKQTELSKAGLAGNGGSNEYLETLENHPER